MFKVAAIQMCSSDNLDENLKNANSLVKEAASNGAVLVVLPENFAFMGKNNKDRLAYKEEVGKGKIQESLAKMAKDHHVWLVGGTIPIASLKNPNKVRAASFVYDSEGQVKSRYDKIHLFDARVSLEEAHHESEVIEPGTDIVVVDTPFAKLGLAVCFDVRFPALFAKLAAEGAEIIALPSAFTVPTGKAHWDILTRGRAIDTFSYVIAAAQGGTHANGRNTFGHTVIVDPWGKKLAEKTDLSVGNITADIDLNLVYTCRKSIPVISG